MSLSLWSELRSSDLSIDTLQIFIPITQERETERERETDRETDREREKLCRELVSLHAIESWNLQHAFGLNG